MGEMLKEITEIRYIGGWCLAGGPLRNNSFPSLLFLFTRSQDNVGEISLVCNAFDEAFLFILPCHLLIS